MPSDHLSFVMVGHVDHGKSTLIGRLLYDTHSLTDGKVEEIEAAARADGRPMEFGYIVDHLREERERGLTIDTAQTFFTSSSRNYVIIDAPGHKEFIKNMITGASQAEAAILICSVAEGVQEQTKRHAYVVKLLGLSQIIVAYNKMDMAGYDQGRFAAVKRDMDAFLARIGVRPTIEVPVSAQKGDNIAGRSTNMPWYGGPCILEALDSLQKMEPPTAKPLRFPVQDVYAFPEFKGERVAAGRVESGAVRPGQELRFLPGDRLLTVREVRKYREPNLPEAEAGECVGLLLDGDGLVRGQVGCEPDSLPLVTNRFRASVFWLSPDPLDVKEDDLVIRLATQEEPCRPAALLERIDSSTLEHLPHEDGRLVETEVGEMVLETAHPVVVESFYDVPELGRFVLVRGHDVVAGGIVTALQIAACPERSRRD